MQLGSWIWADNFSQYLKALIQNIAVVINQSFVQRTTKSKVVHRVALKPMRPQSADTSHWNFYCNDSRTIFSGRSLLHVSLFAPMFFLFFQSKERIPSRSVCSTNLFQPALLWESRKTLDSEKDGMDVRNRCEKTSARLTKKRPNNLSTWEIAFLLRSCTQ